MENIIEKNCLSEYERGMTIYGIEVNHRRSTPDIRDGLKTVQRRILDVMLNHDQCKSKLVKTQSIVGKVLGINHPHGDSSVKDAIKPMSNWFETKLPLIYSESNMGSMQGDPMAAPRYTEIKISDFAMECVIGELDEHKEVVDWIPTYDNRNREPEYFPAKVPLLLINGSYGIGVGMKTEIPKHNLVEVLDATINLIKNPNASVVLIPDHCMNCEIIDTNWKSISNKGIGNYIVRGVIDIERIYDPKRYPRLGDHYALIIKSTPDRVFFDKGEKNGGIKYDILNLIQNGKLPQVVQIDEDSHGDNMRCVIHLRKGSDPNFVRETLYKMTQLQSTYSVNFEALNGIELVRMSYKSYLQFFIEQRKITKFRLYCNKLERTRTKYHERDAYIRLLESGEIDTIIKMIRNQKGAIDDNATMEYLIKTLKITDIQAKFIMGANLKSLSKAYLNKYKEERDQLIKEEQGYLSKITNDDLILQEIIDELEYFKKKYGQPRKCRVISKSDVDNIPKGDFKLVFTENGFIRKINQNELVGSIKGDNPTHILKVENTENVLIFTNQGKVFKLPVHKVPVTEKGAPGIDIRILVKGLTSNIVKVIYEPVLKDLSKKLNKYFLISITAGNLIKRLDLEDFLNVSLSGLLYTKLNDGDYVKDIIISPIDLDVIIYSGKKALRIPCIEIPHYKRNTLGVLAMSSNLPIDGISVIYPDCTDVVVITELGRINKFNIAGLLQSKRGKAGSGVIKLNKGDKIHNIFGVNDSNVIRIVTKNNKYELKVSDIAMGSSISQGSKSIIDKRDNIVKCEVFKTE